MNKAGGVSNAIGKVITHILVVLFVLGIAGGVVYFALHSQGVTFYVEYSGERYFANSDGGSIKLTNSETHNFSVKPLTGGEVNYNVKIVSNGANNILFTTDGEIWYLWNDDTKKDDYSEVFGLQRQSDGFSLTIPDGFTVEKAIEIKYGADIELQDELKNDLCYFVITVSVEESTVKIPFNFFDLTITLNPPQIVF